MEYFADDVDEGSRLGHAGRVAGGRGGAWQGPGSAALARRLSDLDLTAYNDLKMLTLSDTETKVIMRCARADVPHYRALRSADFPEDSVKPELVLETVQVLRDIERTLHAAEEVA